MKYSVKTAIGGMCIALTAAVMLASSIIPFLTYAIPGVASLLVLFMLVECNWKWSLAVYAGASLVCAMVIPEKESVAIYIALLGYYPLLKTVLDKPKKLISYLLKSVFFVTVASGAYYVMIRFFGISTELLEDGSVYFIIVLLVLGLVAFLLYDRTLELLEIAYYRKWQRKIRKIFKRK